MNRETLDITLKTIEDFAKNKITLEKKLGYDARNEFPQNIITQLLSDEIGLHLVFIPEEYGGVGGSAYDIYRVSRLLSEIDLGIATAFLAISLGMDPIRVGGTRQQKEKWIAKIADEGLIVAYCVTEPGAGSEVSNIKTVAEPVYEGGRLKYYKINGTKQFITNGSIADLYTILARAPEGPSFFIVEKGTKGLEAGREEDKHGIRLSNTAQVICDDIIVPAENLVGGVEGQGLRHAQQVFGYTRVMVAAFGLGGGISALKKAIEYSKERVQYGSPLCEKQGYMHKLIVPNVVWLEVARNYIEEVTGWLDGGGEGLETEGAIAKWLATEAGNRAAECAIQAHGGYGYMREYEVEKIKRDVRITTIYEGTSEIMLNTIGMDRWRNSIQAKFNYYSGCGDRMHSISSKAKGTGAEVVAHCCDILNGALSFAFKGRLTRKQFILFKMAEMMAMVETAASMCEKAWRMEEGKFSGTNGDAPCLFAPSSWKDVELIKSISRIYARWTSQKVMENTNLMITNSDSVSRGQREELRKKMGFEKIFDYWEGLEADMNYVGERVKNS